MSIFANPEIVRNVRSQLRPKKAAAVVIICLLLSVSVGYGLLHGTSDVTQRYRTLLQMTFYAQALILGAGGSIACLNNIYKEKDRNSFDFQRLTRLTTTQLTAGKLFGAPVLMYFVCLCLLPVSIYSAIGAHCRISFFLAAYAVLIAASIALHALSLLLSVLSIKGSQTGGIILILVILWCTSYGEGLTPYSVMNLGALGPFTAASVATQTTWSVSELESEWSRNRWAYYANDGMVDALFGKHVHHVPVLLAVDCIFSFWFLLAVVRNIKRDPAEYELYSPVQFLLLALVLNGLLLSFFNWRLQIDSGPATFLLSINLGIFLLLGLALLRNRDRMRNIVHRREGGNPEWLDLYWPLPLVFAGTFAAVALITLVSNVEPGHKTSLGFALLRGLFAALWLARDLQFLQWSSLRKGNSALIMGVIYLVIFYTCTSIIFTAIDAFTREAVSFTAFFLPTPLYWLDSTTWMLRPAIWVAALLAQCLAIAFFVGLQREQIYDLAGRRKSEKLEEAPSA